MRKQRNFHQQQTLQSQTQQKFDRLLTERNIATDPKHIKQLQRKLDELRALDGALFGILS